MVTKFLTKVFGTKAERDFKRAQPVINDINSHYRQFFALSDWELRYKTEEFRQKLADRIEEAGDADSDRVVAETLDELVPEAFAAVKEISRRLVGMTWEVCGIPTQWRMVPFDVQLMGGLVLHQGKIAEMATGEGKTLVATMPIYLNGLTGRGVHLVTVNDYLARRDAQWMGMIYKLLGFTVGCIQMEMHGLERKGAYSADVTYGTNNQFGFDYLRDNTAEHGAGQVQRGHYFALVDEVDSVLIDEARTPLILSGQMAEEEPEELKDLNLIVGPLAREQARMVDGMLAKAERLLEGSQLDRLEAGINIFAAKKGDPKAQRLLAMLAEEDVRKLADEVETTYIRLRQERRMFYRLEQIKGAISGEGAQATAENGDARFRALQEELLEIGDKLYFPVDEKGHVVEISELGRQRLEGELKKSGNRLATAKILSGSRDFLRKYKPKMSLAGGDGALTFSEATRTSLRNAEAWDYLADEMYQMIIDSEPGGDSPFQIPDPAVVKDRIDTESRSLLKEVLLREIKKQDAIPDGVSEEDVGRFLDSWMDEEAAVVPEVKKRLEEISYRDHDDRAGILRKIIQLLKAHFLYKENVDYVVEDEEGRGERRGRKRVQGSGRVVIVDQFTGRRMPGRRYGEGLHQAVEVKEGVKAERETQTIATITVQNYFRSYQKLAGMTGTAETDAGEFHETYKLDVVVIPTNEPVRRVDYEDVVYLTKDEKFQAIIDEIASVREAGRPVLVGTVSVAVSEQLSKKLKNRGIEHSVLSAKHHEQEAVIVAKAGQARVVTIATNMAGRGTDIRLGEGVVKCSRCCYKCTLGDCENCPQENKAAECSRQMRCGLHVIGTERHESRRIDRQLRGRTGRQGDPGSSRFYVSLEDDLMRLFGSDRISGLLSRVGIQKGEPIVSSLLTAQIEKAQRRVEANNFAIRKHLVESEDVLLKQWDYVKGWRMRAMDRDKVGAEIKSMIESLVEKKVERHLSQGSGSEDWDLDGLQRELGKLFRASFDFGTDLGPRTRPEDVADRAKEIALEAYAAKRKEVGGRVMSDRESLILFEAIDVHWIEHLSDLDSIRAGIDLRAYGQKDPRLEYKEEAYYLFYEMVDKIEEITIGILLADEPRIGEYLRDREKARDRRKTRKGIQAFKPDLSAPSPGAVPSGSAPVGGQRRGSVRPVARAAGGARRAGGRKIGRNDPCPCGSGKKYKRCCGIGE